MKERQIERGDERLKRESKKKKKADILGIKYII